MTDPTHKHLILSIVATVILFSAATDALAQRTFVGRVVEVMDGRTVVLEMESGRVTAELENIEIPAAGDPMHKVVTDHLSRMILGKTVEFRPNGLAFKRTFGQIYLNGIDVALQLLRDGAVRFVPAVADQSSFTAAKIYRETEAQAKDERRGIWAPMREPETGTIRKVNFETERPGPLDKWTVYLKNSRQPTNFDGVADSGNVRTGRSNRMQTGYKGIWDDAPDGLGSAGYDTVLSEGFTASPEVRLMLTGARFDREAIIRVVNVYTGEPNRVTDSAWLVTVRIQSDAVRFDDSTDILLNADRRRFRPDAMKYFVRENDDVVDELFVFELEAAELTWLVEAERSGIRVGNYSAQLPETAAAVIADLMAITK